MKKTHLTRKNLIFLALLFFFLFLQAFVFFCLDTNGMMNPKNPIVSMASLFGFYPAELITVDYVAFLLVDVYTFILAFALLFEVRLAKYSNEKVWSKKYVIAYVITVVAYLLLSFGLSILLQLPYTLDKFTFQMGMLFHSLILALVIYLVLGSFVFAVFALIVNFKNIDKPFRFFGKKAAMIEEAKEELEIAEAKQEIAEFDLKNTFDLKSSAVVNPSNTTVNNEDYFSRSVDRPFDKQKVFPGLCMIDQKYELGTPKIESSKVTLKELCDSFRNFLAHEHLYFDENTIRQFISALGTTRLVILEGLSGTGKSSLPRYFADFIHSTSLFVPVQSTWRDRTSLLGHFNEFSQVYGETDFLKHLYEAKYLSKQINVMVLDEFNLSRIEYYFADFLSVLEYPSSEWKINVMQLPFGAEGPVQLEEGKILIPENTFFIGTANKDDSTQTITDKVYDRAITINFDNRNEEFTPVGEQQALSLSYDSLEELFDKAKSTKGNHLTAKDKQKFKVVTDFMYDVLDVTFGNRINNQIEEFVPIFVACGGSKEDALDFMLSSKILYKLEGRFEDYIKQGLLDLQELLNDQFEGKFLKSNEMINKMLRRL